MPLHANAQRIQDLLIERGFPLDVIEMPGSTRTAGDAAAACGCTLAQIGKSLVFRAKPSNRPVLVVASGVNRVDEKKIASALRESIVRADPEFVRASTGFAVGGVPPIGHAVAPVVYLDAELMALERIWCAAGTPRAVFALTPQDLRTLTGGMVLDVKQT
ncbi:MAG: YbaK/EbsC family protein [Alphaproteobacteria bacterium]|nr:YbaK/EbsC family protein [Alphaproteobacteria bacterium]